MTVHKLARNSRLITFLLFLAACAPASCASPQFELTEPVLVPTDNLVHGTATFEILLGSHVYNTAGNLGATFPLGTARSGRFYFYADMLTWIRNPGDSRFEPRRIVYTLEPGYYIQRDDNRYRFFIKHQSFHNSDTFCDDNESYELYGLSYNSLRRPELYVSVGKYVNRCVVDYTWDLVGWATWELAQSDSTTTYFHAWLHIVTENDGPRGRNGFTDYAAELGLRFNSGVMLFARYEFLHDVDRFAGESDHRLIPGITYTW